MDGGELPLLIFDGDCGLCASWAHEAMRQRSGSGRAVAWQSLSADELAALGLDLDQVSAAAWWVDEDGGLSAGHRAIGAALRAGGGWRKLAGDLVLWRPLEPLAAAGYRLLARQRHRLPGATPACRR